MLRTPIIAAVTAVLMAGTALAQSASQPSARMNSSASDTARNAPDSDDDDYGPPPPGARGQAPSAQQAQADRDMFCRRDAAARTGYTTPGQAAHDEQVRGSVGGTLGGAALGAIIGAGSGNAGAGAAIGAGAGLLAGTVVGADNARHAAGDVQAAYGDAYYACMHEDGGRTAAGYGYDAPPPGYGYGGYGYPPPGYYPYPYYGPGYYGYGPGYYGPGVSFGFGFGGGRGFHGGGFRHR
jgi:hypothetical protein